MTKRILSVDDSPTIRIMIEKILTVGGYQVITVDNGMVALGMMEVMEFDMLITDLNMDIMSGLTFIKKVREIPKYAHKPVIFLTTESCKDVKEEGRKRGATGWLTKPVDPVKLLEVVHQLCPLVDAPANDGVAG